MGSNFVENQQSNKSHRTRKSGASVKDKKKTKETNQNPKVCSLCQVLFPLCSLIVNVAHSNLGVSIVYLFVFVI